MATLTVGYEKTYETPEAAIAAADTNDTIEISSITGDPATLSLYWNTDFENAKQLTFRGVGNVGFWMRVNRDNDTMTGVNVFENLTFLVDSRVRALSETITSVTFRRCKWFQTNPSFGPFSINRENGYTQYENCMISTPRNGWEFGANQQKLNLYNTTVYQWTYGSPKTLVSTAHANSIVNVYNCIIHGDGDSFDCLAGTLNEDYNVGQGLTGANDTNLTKTQAGFDMLAYGPFEFRVTQPYELPGTTNANGVDLTTLYTTDIDGRPRTQYSIGCSEGFRLGGAAPGPVYSTNNVIFSTSQE